MDTTGGSGSNYPLRSIVVFFFINDNGAVDMSATMDNLEDRISNLEKSDKSSDETPSSDDTTDENIEKFEVAAKSKGSTSKPENVTAHKVVTQKVQTKPFPAKSLIPIRNFILGLAAAHTRGCIGNKTFGIRKSKDAIVADQDKMGKKEAVSKQCLRNLSSPVFTLNRKKIPNLDPHGLFVNHHRSLFEYDFVLLDSKLESKKSAMDNSFTLGFTKEGDNVKILNPSRVASGKNFLQSFGGGNDTMLVLIDIPGILHLQGRLFESRGCLLLVCRDDIGSIEFAIYEMMKGLAVWTVSIRLGEREEDYFLVIKLSGNVVKYNLISKTICQIFDIGSNQMDDDDDYDFFPPYTVDHNPYEFIPSFASV
ncbi:hypothetical protein Tco_0760507 [Tanacetum coccineum]